MALAIQKLAQILRTREEILETFGIAMNKLVGIKNVFEEIAEENDSQVRRALGDLGFSKDSSAEDVYHALITKLRQTDEKISQFLNTPTCATPSGCKTVIDLAKTIKGTTGLKGFVI